MVNYGQIEGKKPRRKPVITNVQHMQGANRVLNLLAHVEAWHVMRKRTGESFHMRFEDTVVYVPRLEAVPASTDNWRYKSVSSVPDPKWHEDAGMVAEVDLIRARMRESVGAQQGDEVENAFMYTLGFICSGHVTECKWIMFAGVTGSGGGKSAVCCLLESYLGQYYRQATEGPLRGTTESAELVRASALRDAWVMAFPEINTVGRSYQTAWLKKMCEETVLMRREFKVDGIVQYDKVPRTWNTMLFVFNGDLKLLAGQRDQEDVRRRSVFVPFYKVAKKDDTYSRKLSTVGGDNVTRRAGVIYLCECVKYYEENMHKGWEGVIPASWSDQLEGMLARVSGEDIPAKVVLPVECAPETKIWAESATTEEYLQNFFRHFNIVEVPAGKIRKKEEQYGEPLSVIRNTCEQGWTGAGKTAEWKSAELYKILGKAGHRVKSEKHQVQYWLGVKKRAEPNEAFPPLVAPQNVRAENEVLRGEIKGLKAKVKAMHLKLAEFGFNSADLGVSPEDMLREDEIEAGERVSDVGDLGHVPEAAPVVETALVVAQPPAAGGLGEGASGSGGVEGVPERGTVREREGEPEEGPLAKRPNLSLD
jgi:hypothetical protein